MGKILRHYRNSEIIYPNPTKDGLVLWYEFTGKKNTDANKEVVEDLSGNGNNTSLINMSFTEGSGYGDNEIIFDDLENQLNIPELTLDKTNMTFQVNDGIYSYDGDKVMTVGEDGEIKTLEVNIFNVGGATSWWEYNSIDGHDGRKVSTTVQQSTFGNWNLLVGSEDTMVEADNYYTISGTMLWNGDPIPSDFFLEDNIMDRAEITQESLYIDDSTGYFEAVVYVNQPYIYFIHTKTQAVLGDTVTFDSLTVTKGMNVGEWSPSPEDLLDMNITQSSIRSLKIYNRSLSGDELLQNVESEGMIQLKNGYHAQDGLILHYDFSNETNNGGYKDRAFDYSGNELHGTLQNFDYTETSGYTDGGLRVDSVDDYVATQTTELSTFTIAMTVEFGVEDNQIMFGGSPSSIYARRYVGHGFHASVLTDSRLDFWVPDVFVSQEIVRAHCGLMVDSENMRVKLFVNGQIILDEPLVTPPSSFTLTRIGAWSAPASTHLNGVVYSAQVYDRALDASEILHNYQVEAEKFNL